LTHALSTIITLEKENKSDRRLGNMLTTAKLIAVAALQRKESRGGHFRSDYPTLDERLAKRSFLSLAKAEEIASDAAEIAGARAAAVRRA
jgi:L-aspartate oxidase